MFIIAFTAFTGSVSHFAIGGTPLMVVLIYAAVASCVFCNKRRRDANRDSMFGRFGDLANLEFHSLHNKTVDTIAVRDEDRDST